MPNNSAQRSNPVGPEAVKWQPAEGLLIEVIGDEYLVLNKARGRIHQFNHSAAIVWRGIMNEQTLDEIALALMERFDIPDFRARKDALKMISQLKILKLVTEEPVG